MLLPLTKSEATNYYIKATGSDTAIGTKPSRAWKTCNPLYSFTLKAGDSVLFNGGDTLITHFYVAPADSGTATNPIYFGSYGKGRAVIYADTFWCFFLYNNGGFVFDNLEMMGSGITTNKNSGFFYYSDHYAGHAHYFLRLNRLYNHDFGADGIEIYDSDSAYYGISNISITYCELADNGGGGISTGDLAGMRSKLYGIKKLRISYCNALRNNTNGIVLGGVDSALVEHCLVAYTGFHNNKGTAGIWAWSSKDVVIQYCISHDMKTIGSDGEGYDLDGGTQHCIIQYCYSYNNDDLGFMHCDYPYSRPTKNNTIRYCLSQNDGRKHLKGGYGFLFISWGSGLDSCNMYNNDVYMPDNDSGTVAGFAAYILNGYDSGVHIRNCNARNNIIYLDGVKKNYLVWTAVGNHPIGDSNLLFQDNCYFSTHSNSHNWLINNKTYSDIKQWRDSAGQEFFGSLKTGDTLNPLLMKPGKAPRLNNTDSLIYLDAYKLMSKSPMIDAGLNLDSLFGVNIGKSDFYGNNPKQGKGQNLGLYENPHVIGTETIRPVMTEVQMYPLPAHKYIDIKLNNNNIATVVKVYNITGIAVMPDIQTSLKVLRLDISQLSVGLYILTATTNNNIATGKFIVE